VKGEPYKAIAILQDALKLAPGNAAIHNNLGVAFFHAKNLAEARSHLASASKAEPANDAPLFNLAMLAQQQGDTAAATRLWQKYLEHASGDWAAVARVNLVSLHPSPHAAGAPPDQSTGGCRDRRLRC
jgi:Flp pilus assembly protein TadD